MDFDFKCIFKLCTSMRGKRGIQKSRLMDPCKKRCGKCEKWRTYWTGQREGRNSKPFRRLQMTGKPGEEESTKGYELGYTKVTTERADSAHSPRTASTAGRSFCSAGR